MPGRRYQYVPGLYEFNTGSTTTHTRALARACTHTHIHTHAHTHAHTSVVTIQNLIYAQLKTGSKQRPETDEDSSTERKAWQVYSLGKEMS